MTALDLSLDDYFSLPEGSDQTPVKELTAGKDGYTDHKALAILDAFLQPHSTICLESAVNSIINLLPAKEPWENEALSVASLCYEVALHIPWNHPSQLKLAWLVEKLGWSEKFTKFASIKSASDTHLRHWFFGDLARESWDNAQRVDPENPKELQGWVNFCAFQANLDALNVWSQETPCIAMTLNPVFEQPRGPADLSWHPNAPDVERTYRDAYIMAAAQWIIWDGQNLYRRALYKGPPEGSKLSDDAFFDVEKTSVTRERWNFWKQGFKVVPDEDGVGEECKNVALRAYKLMETLEKCMPS